MHLLKSSGFEPVIVREAEGYVSWNKILHGAKICTYVYIELEGDWYFFSPSGRVGDIQILDLIPLISSQRSADTSKVLDSYQIKYKDIDDKNT